jgi:PAS domain S-box-containing protein
MSSEPIRVLHVDDDPQFGSLVADFLVRESERMELVSETSASGGIDLLRAQNETFDCIVSDYDMPETDGLEFLDAVRDSHPDLPFILFTGKGSEEVASDAISRGATDYLQKGGGTEQYELLANRVENAVKQYRHEHERDLVYQALETATQGIALLDAEGRYRYLNEAYAELYGYDPDVLVGEHWEQLYPASEVERLRAEALPVLEAEGNWSGRSSGVRADGSSVPEQVSLTKLDTGGHVCVVKDISDRVERQRELEAATQRLEAILENTTTPMFMKDRDGEYILVNWAWRELFGLQNETVRGRTDEEILPPDVASEVRENDELVLERDEPVEIEERIVVDGEERTYLSSKVPIHDIGTESDPEDPIALFGLANDITERKEREREQEAYLDALDRVHDVTTNPDLAFEEKIEELLDVGRKYLDVPYGFLSEIDVTESCDAEPEGTQLISEAVGPHDLLQPGKLRR